MNSANTTQVELDGLMAVLPDDDCAVLQRIIDGITITGECWVASGCRNKTSKYVHLCIRNTQGIRYVHRFIAHWFSSLPLNHRTHQCHHLCGNKQCCRPSHLKSLTIAAHQAHTTADGCHPCGDQASWSILTDAQVLDYRRRYRAGERCPALAKEAGVHRLTMLSALVGETFAHVADAVVDIEYRRDWRGERHRGARLKQADIAPIYTAFWEMGQSILVLGKQYGVSDETIRSVVHNKSWLSVQRPAVRINRVQIGPTSWAIRKAA